MNEEIFIPIAIPDLSGNEEKYVVDAIRSTWISSSGQYIDRFEKDFAQLCEVKHSITVSNGTVALQLALLTLGLQGGDEVILPSLTYISTANAVHYINAKPVFVEVDPATWCLDPTKIENAITPRTKGIIAVHLYGHPADMDAINQIAKRHKLWVVEDAAEAPLARYKGRPIGGLADIASFSFYGNKVLTCGEGGALTLNDDRLDRMARMLRGQGVDPTRRYFFPIVGYNFRLSNVAAAILCAQIERSENILFRRRQIFDLYSQNLRGVPGITLQQAAPWATLSPWLFSILIDSQTFGRTRDEFMSLLKDRGIDTRPFFVPLHTLPPYSGEPSSRNAFPITNALSASGVNLPTYPGLLDEDVIRICNSIKNLGKN